MSDVLDIKPTNSLVIDTKPKMVIQPGERGIQLYQITITAGMWMPIPILTYPNDQTFLSPITQ